MELDKRHIWHPYTNLEKPLPVYEVESAEGVYLNLKNGKKLIDGMSSWWACIHGYNRPELNDAARQQLGKMSHVMFGGITHAPAIELTEKLLSITPKFLDNVFYSDSGSVSVEVAMKMAIQYQHANNKPKKKKFITARNGYHGDTSAAMSVCDPISGMHTLFSGFLPQHVFGPAFPLGYDSEVEENILAEYRKLLENHHQELAAFIIEPVVQGAGGMRIYNPTYLKKIQTLCIEFGILFIADEIATGFGRTGKLFASEHAQIKPDILCLGKALSGGYMSFAATLTTRKVADKISNNPPYVFMHGPTFMGNPLACSISLASIKLLEKNLWSNQISRIESVMKRELRPNEVSNAKDIRILGAIGIIEFEKNINVAEAQKFFVNRGVWIRPFKNLVYIMPPFVIKENELITLINSMKEMSLLEHCFVD